LPLPLLKRRFPAQILNRLNYDDDSPLQGRIRTPTTTTGVIKDNSVLKMLTMSIEDGALYEWFDGEHGSGDLESMLVLLKRYWSAVAGVFPDAWEAQPRRSRLVHGVGIVALGCLMDEISYRLDAALPTTEEFATELARISDQCAWTQGFWQIGVGERRRWNELQNTPRDIKVLSDHLLGSYRRAIADDLPARAVA
jgi:DNA-sulfur modification-associated